MNSSDCSLLCLAKLAVLFSLNDDMEYGSVLFNLSLSGLLTYSPGVSNRWTGIWNGTMEWKMEWNDGMENGMKQ